MSGPLAVAATSAVLRELLLDGLGAMNLNAILVNGNFEVTLLAPDLVPRPSSPTDPQLNIFMFNAVRNSVWAGHALPSRDSRSHRLSNPILALDLHYLISAYAGRDLEAEILLGAALQVLHDTPGLDRATIRAALSPSPPRVPPELLADGLADQTEALKISPMPLPSEEIARLWSALQTPYRPSAAFTVSVLLIETAHSTRQSLPVRERMFLAQPMRELRVERVRSAAGPRLPITPSTRLRIEGRALGGVDLQVWINGLDFTSHVQSRTEQAIELELQPLPAGLRAGVGGVQIVQPAMLGIPPTPHEGVASNIAGFVLQPELSVDPSLPAPDVLRVDFAPPVNATQRVRLRLNEVGVAAGVTPRSFSVAAPAGNGVVAPFTQTSRIDFDVAAVPAARYLVRLEVDGAQTVLRTDAAGIYNGPEVTL